MTGSEFLRAARKAFIDRDVPALEHALAALLQPDFASFTRNRLEEHRNELHVRLAAVNDHLQHHDRLRAGRVVAQFEAEEAAERIDGDQRAQGTSSIEPSEP